MRKITLSLGLLMAAVIILAACGQKAPAPSPTPAPSPAPAPAPKPINLAINTYLPPMEVTARTLGDWAKELKEKTGGLITYDYTPGAGMGPPPEYYDILASGRVDVTMFYPNYTPGLFPMTDIMTLPLTNQATGAQHSRAFYDLYKKGYFDKEFKDIKVLFLYVISPHDYHMAKEPVRTFDDMKGKKIRVSGKLPTDIVKALGSTPVGMPASEIYASMERGIIDGHFGQAVILEAFSTIPVTKHISNVGLMAFPFVIGMNMGAWNKLPADVKTTIEGLSAKYSALGGERYDEGARSSLGKLKAAGGQINDLPPAELKKAWDAMATITPAWIAEMEGKGFPAKTAVKDLHDSLKAMGIQTPIAGYTP